MAFTRTLYQKLAPIFANKNIRAYNELLSVAYLLQMSQTSSRRVLTVWNQVGNRKINLRRHLLNTTRKDLS